VFVLHAVKVFDLKSDIAVMLLKSSSSKLTIFTEMPQQSSAQA
jgi:hypothetical protein